MNKEEQWLLEEKYGGVESEAFHADCERLQAGEPLGYVIGHVPFLGCTIYLDGKPLIPRPETEWWVERAIEVIQIHTAPPKTFHSNGRLAATDSDEPCAHEPTATPLRILDLCAGSGAIGIAVAKAIPSAHMDFAEIDPNLLPTIKKNLFHNLPTKKTTSYLETPSSSSRPGLELGINDQFRIIEADLFTSLSSRPGLELSEYDFILSNPPYIDPALDRTERSVKNFEPHLALYGGAAGMELIEKIIANAPAHLNTSGQLWIEHEPEQAAAIIQLATQNHFLATTHNDQFGVDRYSVLVLQ